MLKEAVLHLQDSNYAFALNENTVVLRLRTKKDDIRKCTLFFGDRAYSEDPIVMESVPMETAGSDGLFSYYECRLTSGYTRICYYFLLEDETEQIYYYSDEFHTSPSEDRTEYYQFAYVHRNDICRVPEWAYSAVLYQIFPDSFATGRREIRRTEAPAERGKRCGGRLRGIRENLDYIAGIGANCLYLNPIFTASSYHKYDTADYFSVDPGFGTKEELKKLVGECHKRGIRVILDGVFNHCGWSFFAFQDVLQNQEKSRYADWFYKIDFPVRFEKPLSYATFAYVGKMPKLNTGNPEVVRYLCRVGTYWIKEADIDGWRLDVANEINHDFWREFRREVKAVKPDVFLIGEIWEDAPQWLQGDQLDSTMNYRFSNLCKGFFGQRRLTTEEFDQKIHAMTMRYKSQITYAQMNLLDSHDVPRFLSKCGGDVRRLKLSFFFQMTFVGLPSIFYGDEAEVQGVTETEYRKPMPWTDRMEEGGLYRYIKKLTAVRKTHPALIFGNFETVQIDDAAYAFFRRSDTERLLVVINNSDTEKILNFLSIRPGLLLRGIFPQQEETPADKIRLAPMEGKIFLMD